MIHTINNLSNAEVKKVLANVYEADRAATYCRNKTAVVGSVISAFSKKTDKGYTVELSSNYYMPASLCMIAGTN